MSEPAERLAIVAGIGQSEVGRRLGRTGLDLTLEACERAVDDAGLTMADIDGLSTYPGMMQGMSPFSGPGGPEVHDALRLELSWHDGGVEGPGQLRAVFSACMAVACGLARNVLVYRTVTESSAQGGGSRQGLMTDGVENFMQWTLPFRAFSAANWVAMYAQRHMDFYGTTRTQLGGIAVNGRTHAGLNPAAVYRDPLTIEEYLESRQISEPLCLFDCDVPVDGSTAFVISHRDAGPDLPHVPIAVEAIGTALRGRPSWDQFDDLSSMAARDAAAHMWSRTDLSPRDVNVAELYDGFSILTLIWLEALGFCGQGEGGAFVEGGQRIGISGELPLNTHGGQLSAGRLHGFGFLHEACIQLRGDAGARQVRGAEVAAVAAGGGPIAGSMLVRRGTAG